MSFNREKLPNPVSYFEGEGLMLRGHSKWKTTECRFHGGGDSLRINTQSGGWVCMSCGVKGGDVLSYHMQAYGMEFDEAAKALGAWVDDGKPQATKKPTALPPRSALEVLGRESTIVAIAAGNIAQGLNLTDEDRSRLMVCAGRINKIAGDFV